jgi:hypothetical protein
MIGQCSVFPRAEYHVGQVARNRSAGEAAQGTGQKLRSCTDTLPLVVFSHVVQSYRLFCSYSKSTTHLADADMMRADSLFFGGLLLTGTMSTLLHTGGLATLDAWSGARIV